VEADSEAPPTVADKPDATSSEDTDRSVSEHEAEPAHTEPAPDKAAEVAPEALSESEVEKEEEPSP
jgi:hypothetical protein